MKVTHKRNNLGRMACHIALPMLLVPVDATRTVFQVPVTIVGVTVLALVSSVHHRRRIFGVVPMPLIVGYSATVITCSLWMIDGVKNIGAFANFASLILAGLCFTSTRRIASSSPFWYQTATSATLFALSIVVTSVVVSRHTSIDLHQIIGIKEFEITQRAGEVRYTGFTSHPIVAALLCGCALIMWLQAAARQPRMLRRSAALTMSCVSGYAVIVTRSRGPLLVMILLGFIALAQLRPQTLRSRRAKHGVLALSVIFTVFWGPSAWNSAIASSDSTSKLADQQSLEYRIALPRAAFISALDHWALGSGPGRSPDHSLPVTISGNVTDYSRTIDNELLLVLYEYGWIGFISSSLVYLFIVKRWLASERRLGSSGNRWAVPFYITLSGLFVALSSWSPVMSFFGGAIGLALSSGQGRRSSAPPLAASHSAAEFGFDALPC